FSGGKTRFMVATDVAARGIDVSNIGLVVNFDMPRALEDYIHRVGRTGRAGSEGEAISLVTRLDGALQREIVAHLEKSSAGLAKVIVDGKVLLAPGRPARGGEEAAPRGADAGERRREAPRARR